MIQYTLYIAHYAVYSVHYKMHMVHYTLYSSHYTLSLTEQNVQCTVWNSCYRILRHPLPRWIKEKSAKEEK